MPYIRKQGRKILDPEINALKEKIFTVGELNYSICMLCKAWVKRHNKHYYIFNDIIGVLECAKMEIYRRLAAPYEDGMSSLNGDVFREL